MYLIILVVSIFLIVYSYVLYPLILLIYTKWRRKPMMAAHHEEYAPHVTVLIAAHNEEKVIGQKIANTLALDYPKEKMDVLIGSDGSTDATETICRHHDGMVALVDIQPRQGKSNVLNTLVPLAQGEILLFSDANTFLEPSALKNIVGRFQDVSIGGVCGRLLLNSQKDGLESYETVYWRYESKLKWLESEVYSTIGANGGLYAIRKSLYKPIPKDTIIDDFWISMDILEQGKRVYFQRSSVAYEDVSQNIGDEFRRKVRIGSGNLQALLRRPVIANQQHWFAQFAFFSHKIVRWTIPLLVITIYVALLMLSSNPAMKFAFYGFTLLILAACVSLLLKLKNSVLNLLTYFLVFNFALLVGYISYLFGVQKVTWKRAER
jgi:poly-beta-1,6-N-acetyl-D-glucosamine synthase